MRVLEALRDWRRMRRRARKRLARLAEADVVFMSPGKAGRTWVRVMLSHVYHQRRGTPLDELIGADNFHRLDPAIPIIYFTHDINEPPAVRRALNADDLEPRKLVHLVRDPRDVAVSRFHHFAFRHDEAQRRRRAIPDDLATTSLFDFVTDERLGLPVVIASLNRWAEIRARMSRVLLLRYEDLHADPVREMRRLVDFLGEPASDAELRAAVEFARFESLRKREAEGFFKQEILRPGASGDPRSFKVRRGKAGGYREDFTAEQLAVLDRLVDERLVDGYGYKTGERTPALNPADSPAAS
jgi:alcohol sulfotransferase